jgi:hypothetical protein
MQINRTLTETQDTHGSTRISNNKYLASLLNFKEFLETNISQMTGIPPGQYPLYGLRYNETNGIVVGLENNTTEIIGNGDCLFDSLLYIENDGNYKGTIDQRTVDMRRLRNEIGTHAIDMNQHIEYDDVVPIDQLRPGEKAGTTRNKILDSGTMQKFLNSYDDSPEDFIRTYCDLKKKHIILFTLNVNGSFVAKIYLNRKQTLNQVDFLILSNNNHYTTLKKTPGFQQKSSSFFKNLQNKKFDHYKSKPTYQVLCNGAMQISNNENFSNYVDSEGSDLIYRPSMFDERIIVDPFARRYSELYYDLFDKPHNFNIVKDRGDTNNQTWAIYLNTMKPTLYNAESSQINPLTRAELLEKYKKIKKSQSSKESQPSKSFFSLFRSTPRTGVTHSATRQSSPSRHASAVNGNSHSSIVNHVSDVNHSRNTQKKTRAELLEKYKKMKKSQSSKESQPSKSFFSLFRSTPRTGVTHSATRQSSPSRHASAVNGNAHSSIVNRVSDVNHSRNTQKKTRAELLEKYKKMKKSQKSNNNSRKKNTRWGWF